MTTSNCDNSLTDLKKLFGKVAVLMGGNSERDVSLQSGQRVLAALQSQGIDAFGLDVRGNVIELLQANPCDRVFNILHGGDGESGLVQSILQTLNLPFPGSDYMGSVFAMDKVQAKRIWKSCNVPTPDFWIYNRGEDLAALSSQLTFPLFVKPASGGSSIGTSYVERLGALETAVQWAIEYDTCVLLEEYINGSEYTVPIFQGRELPSIRIEVPSGFYDYDAKYIREDTKYYVPSGLTPSEERDLQIAAQAAFLALKCRHWGRVDAIRDQKGRFYFIDVNPLPGMTEHSLYPMSAKAAGFDFNQIVVEILKFSL